MKKKIVLLINVGEEELKDIYNGLTWAAPTEDVPDEINSIHQGHSKNGCIFYCKKEPVQCQENIQYHVPEINRKLGTIHH